VACSSAHVNDQDDGCSGGLTESNNQSPARTATELMRRRSGVRGWYLSHHVN